MAPVIALGFILLVALGLAYYRKPVKKADLSPDFKQILDKNVRFYRALDEEKKRRFEEKIQEFLGYVRIHGVDTTVDETDRLLVAASGVIPIFGFPEWKYYNLSDVLLYPDTFNEKSFSSKETERSVLGMVGDGPMQRVMILSKPSLYAGFNNYTDKENVGIHEFVHLLDKDDGAVDGIPESLLDKQYTIPWLNLIRENIGEIKEGDSDINIYGATNKSEFFAVASEYFFERPDLFKEKHPELYQLMVKVFHQQPPALEPEKS